MEYQHNIYVEHRLTITLDATSEWLFEPPRRQPMLVTRLVFGQVMHGVAAELSKTIVTLYGHTARGAGQPISTVERREIVVLDQCPDHVAAMWLDWRDARYAATDAAIKAGSEHPRDRAKAGGYENRDLKAVWP